MSIFISNNKSWEMKDFSNDFQGRKKVSCNYLWYIIWMSIFAHNGAIYLTHFYSPESIISAPQFHLLQFHVIMRAYTTIICLFIVQLMFLPALFLFTFHSMPQTCMYHICIIVFSPFVFCMQIFYFMYLTCIFAPLFNSIRQANLHLSS